MTSKNEHTGQKQQTKPASETYRDNYDRIFNKRKETMSVVEPKQHKLSAETIPLKVK